MSVLNGTASSHVDFMAQLEDALVDQGHAWGQSFVGVGDGRLTGVSGDEGGYIGGVASIGETFEITALTATTFSVIGGTSGSLGTATAGTPFTSTRLNFLITVGGTAFVPGDKFYLNTSPAWERIHATGCRNKNFVTSDMNNKNNLLDNNGVTYADKVGFPAIVRMELLYPDIVRRVTLTIEQVAYAPDEFHVEYSDDDSAWTDHQTFTASWATTGEGQSFNVTGSPGSHKYWRIRATSGVHASILRIGEVRFSNDVNSNYWLNDHVEILFEAKGLSGDKSILIGAEFYENTDTSTYNFSWYNLRAWNPLNRIRDQLPDFDLVSLPATDQPFEYWLFINGQRVVIILKVGAVYVSGYLGFGNPYEQPSVHDYPMIMAASGNVESRRVDSTDANQRSITDPGRYGMKAWYPASGWKNHANIFDQSNDDTADTVTLGKVWPAMTQFGSMASVWFMRENLDGSFPMFPVVLTHDSGPNHIWGELDGVFVTTGFGNSPEAVIRYERMDHKVFQNQYRATYQDFFAVRMD